MCISLGKSEKTTLANSWKKVFFDIDSGEDDFLSFSQEEITVTQLANMAKQVPGGESIDEDENIDEWFQCDKDLPSLEMMSDEEIVRRATQGQGEMESDEEGVEEGGEEASADTDKITHSAALKHLECFLDYLEGQEDTLICDKLMLPKLRSSIAIKERHTKRQTRMTDFFKRSSTQ